LRINPSGARRSQSRLLIAFSPAGFKKSLIYNSLHCPRMGCAVCWRHPAPKMRKLSARMRLHDAENCQPKLGEAARNGLFFVTNASI
jgi:hypothetical protein